MRGFFSFSGRQQDDPEIADESSGVTRSVALQLQMLRQRVERLQAQHEILKRQRAELKATAASDSPKRLRREAEVLRKRCVRLEARAERERKFRLKTVATLEAQLKTLRDEHDALRLSKLNGPEPTPSLAPLRQEIAKLRERAQTLGKRHDFQRNRHLISTQRLQQRIKTLQDRSAVLQRQRDELRAELASLRMTPQRLNELVDSTPAGGFAKAIARGQELVDAAVLYTRSQLSQRERIEARAFAHALCGHRDTRRAGLICSAIQAHYDGFYALAHKLFGAVDKRLVRQVATTEWIDTLLEVRDARADAELDSVIDRSQAFAPSVLLAVARCAIGRGRFDHADRLLLTLAPRLDDLTPEDRKQADWISARLKARIQRVPGTKKAEIPNLALIDYKTIDVTKASSNIGDYVQTLAMLSNMVRFSSVRFEAADERLAKFVGDLQSRVQATSRRDDVSGRARVELLDRDYASGRDYATPTWLIAFGWYMHPNFGQFFDFPFPDSIRPIFISFHVNNPGMLSHDAVKYLRKYQPIGCRDWTTVYLLREKGIAAFFSGCITTTIGKIFEPIARPSERQTRPRMALVDSRAKRGEFAEYEHSPLFLHGSVDVREADATTNLEKALETLATYREFDAIATSRLHCYLPCRALGLDVHFRPRNLTDVRFEGLLELDDQQFQTVCEGIEHKLAAVLEVILSGGDERSVYARWAEVCRDSLDEAERYARSYPSLGGPSFDVGEAVRSLRANSVSSPAVWSARKARVEVALATDQNLAEELPVVLESVLDNTKEAIRFHIMTRGLGEAYWNRLQREFANEAEFVFYDFGAIDYGSNLRLLNHTTVSTIDRLLLPDLLEKLHKVIYLDVDIVVLSDVAKLWRVRLGDRPIAGKSSTSKGWRYGYNMVYRAASRLPYREAWALRRQMHDQGPLVFNAFNAGVVVMNLDRMRRDDFAKRFIPLVERCAMNDQDVLNVYARTERLELDLEWNAVPSQDVTDGAHILHYAGPVKPWSGLYIVRKADFLAYRSRYLRRKTTTEVVEPTQTVA